MEKKNDLLELTFEFALDIIEYTEQLESLKKYVLARQLMKSGTSIGANSREAQSAESLIDFIHKLKIAAKESEETEYWLLLCQHSKNHPDPQALLDENLRIKKLLSSIISTSKNKLKS
ncbi:MAG: four helix bundle protein [Bacteroidales bacterium]